MQYDVAIIGGGIVGLSTAWQLLRKRPELRLCLLEKEEALARHQTGNNSGVIHSGIYYKPGSLKALNCIKGYRLLLDFCQSEHIAHEVCGKVIVATRHEELQALHNVYERGVANGLDGIRKVSAGEIKEIEPHVNGLEGIWVPQTGIVDYKGMSKRLGELIQHSGGNLYTNQTVSRINTGRPFSEIVTQDRSWQAKLVVNCAGLYSDKIAAMTQPHINFRIIPFRGEYYELRPEKHHLVRNLIYPVPDPNFPFLGVHFTRMIHGGIEAGPNAVFAFKREGYRRSDIHAGELAESLAWPGFRKVALKYWRTGLGEYYRSFSKAAFTKALQRLIPEIQEQDLIPGGAGVRAQACERNGGLLDDFLLLQDDFAIHVGNAPSPAATSALSIGDTVADMASKRL